MVNVASETPIRRQAGDGAVLHMAMPDGSRPNILLAEDSAAARVLTAALLKRMGCDVDPVEHGEEALAHIQSFSYDLVLMDIEMPVMDGVVAAQEIRALGGAAARTPIVALSAFMADARRATAWKDTFDDSLPKPASKEQLYQLISRVLNAGDEAAKPADSPPAATSAAPAASTPLLIDNERMAAIKNRVQPDGWQNLVAAAVNEIRTCTGNLQMPEIVSQPDTVRALAHKLYGIAASFAMPELADRARQLETRAVQSDGTQLAPDIAGLVNCCKRTLSALAPAQPINQ